MSFDGEKDDVMRIKYSVGSVVWARMRGWTWWPAMVDDCPDTKQFYRLDGFRDIPTHYHVVFFDEDDVTRAWISSKQLMPYAQNKKMLKRKLRNNKYKKRLNIAMAEADDAGQLPLESRLIKYKFITRYKGDSIPSE